MVPGILLSVIPQEILDGLAINRDKLIDVAHAIWTEVFDRVLCHVVTGEHIALPRRLNELLKHHLRGEVLPRPRRLAHVDCSFSRYHQCFEARQAWTVGSKGGVDQVQVLPNCHRTGPVNVL
jgi:hypothetical protein